VLPAPRPQLHPSDDAEIAARPEALHEPPSHPSDDGRRPERIRSAAIFLGIVVLMGADLLEDWRRGSRDLPLGLESVVLILAAIGLWLLQRRIRQERADARALRTRLAEANAAAESWRRETEVLAAGLGRAIDAQFQAWRLTDAEREVALLLLKGLSLREIAGLRETSERTVRQQSLAVYRKAGLAGRGRSPGGMSSGPHSPQRERLRM
jgi:DNA-binding CsgD family transcriptional regulator